MTEIVNNRNPQTQVKLTEDLIKLVKDEYRAEYGEKMRHVIPSGITMQEIQDFKTGIDTFKTAFENSLVGRRIMFEKAINLYLEDLIEITGELERQKYETIADLVRQEYRSLGMIQ